MLVNIYALYCIFLVQRDQMANPGPTDSLLCLVQRDQMANPGPADSRLGDGHLYRYYLTKYIINNIQ